MIGSEGVFSFNRKTSGRSYSLDCFYFRTFIWAFWTIYVLFRLPFNLIWLDMREAILLYSESTLVSFVVIIFIVMSCLTSTVFSVSYLWNEDKTATHI